MTTPITVYGAYWCPDCRRSKRFLSEHQIPYTWVDIEQNADAQAYVEQLNNGKRIIPTIVFGEEDDFLVEPSNAELAQKLGLATTDPHDFHDVTIIGAGPAGLAAAIYLARDGFKVMVIDEGALGGQAATTEALDNYPGFPDGIGGGEWAQRTVAQARRFDVEFLQAQTVLGLRGQGQSLWVKTGDGHEYGSCAVLIATGADYRRLGVAGEEDFIGAGVHFCSTCDGPFYKGKNVAVVGGGNSAVEEAIGLLRFATRVTLLVRGDRLKASKVAIDKIMAEERITIHFNTTVTELSGDNKLEKVVIENTATGATETLSPDGLFVFIGQQPNTSFLSDSGLWLDDYGFILTGHQLAHRPDWPANERRTTLETSVPGVFAAGDVRVGSTKQVAAAAGEGATAALLIREHLNNS
ncbi:MAG: FAD-dependent oxidoreductase [Anaerolineae bacterium]|nr:FAD-dependent oxidoreductase [Anaerolineae bacterium]